jgi:eukaryotic-like serine/threonine-protein kinase
VSGSPTQRGEQTVIGVPPPPNAPARVDDSGFSEDAETRIAVAPRAPKDALGFLSDPGGTVVGDGRTLTGVVLAGRYKLVRVIGEGGMGLVYEARHIGIEKRFAVKVLADELVGQPIQVERFIREAKTASRIENEHIVEISDFGVTPTGSVFFAMEYLDGEDLGMTIRREGAMPWPRVRHIMLQICAALGAAHAQGVVHRDMKPQNCFRMARRADPDFIKVFDFGIAKLLGEDHKQGAKLTRTGQIFGTPEYMSPEQVKGAEADSRMDIYAAGVILFELLTGRTPFEGGAPLEVLSRHLAEPVPEVSGLRKNLNTPKEVSAVVAKSLAKDVTARYQTAAELAAAITAVPFVERRGHTQISPSLRRRPRADTPLGQRQLFLAILITAFAIMLVLGTAWALGKLGG